jgi:hypothetical protein
MRSVIIVEVFQSLKLCIEINIICVGQQLIKLCLMRSVSTFYFAVKLGVRGFIYTCRIPWSSTCQ